jgi:ABC-2 type transport system ATP-binding protein
MKVWEYLDFFARCYDIAAPQRRQVTDELLALVDLTEKRDAFVQTLSRGMRQRLCLAHALVHDPQILLLDEPASGLDPRARVEIRELLKELQAMGKTLIVSSHILSELGEICDQVGIIEQGKLLFSGSVGDVHRQLRRERLLRIRVISEQETAVAALREYRGVGDIAEVKGQLEVDFTGDDKALAGLHAHLVNAGVAVTSFGEAVGDLEEVFLQITRGEVA